MAARRNNKSQLHLSTQIRARCHRIGRSKPQKASSTPHRELSHVKNGSTKWIGATCSETYSPHLSLRVSCASTRDGAFMCTPSVQPYCAAGVAAARQGSELKETWPNEQAHAHTCGCAWFAVRDSNLSLTVNYRAVSSAVRLSLPLWGSESTSAVEPPITRRPPHKISSSWSPCLDFPKYHRDQDVNQSPKKPVSDTQYLA